MIVQKYEHACFSLTKDNKTLIVDPGNWSDDFITPANVVAVVITHEHGDHFDHDKLQLIAAQNPNAILIAHEGITSQVTEMSVRTVKSGEVITINPFTLSFFGGQHATVHSNYPIVSNLGVLINNSLYYPGDSFTLPNQPVDMLAVPAAAPWLKTGEAMDFCKAVNARLVFPTHDAILSDTGKALADSQLSSMSNNYIRLVTPLEIDG